MAVLICEENVGLQPDTRLEATLIKILQTKISFRFRRGDGVRKLNCCSFRDNLKSAVLVATGFLRISNSHRAD